MKPTHEQIAKLPNWAQDHVAQIERERDAALAECHRRADTETPSPLFVDDWYSPSKKRHYIQSISGCLTIQHAGVNLEVFLAREDDSQRLYGIELTYSEMVDGKPKLAFGYPAIIPRGNCSIQIVNKNHL